MTKQEIVALIAAKIEGQGTNVDAGSVLPAILNGIIDLIPDGGGESGVKVIVSTADWRYITDKGVTASSIAGLAELIGISEDDLSGIFEVIRQGGVLPIIMRNDPGSSDTWYYLPKDSYSGGENFDARWTPVGGQPSEIEIAQDGDTFAAYQYTE